MGQIQDAGNRAADYAMPTDFCTVFNYHLDHLYTLSLLLTADHYKAEQCFVAGLEDCLQGNSVYRERMLSWATRAVIKNAILIVLPSRNKTETTTQNYYLKEPVSGAETPAAAITKLQPFARFVYVMSALEKYSDRECSILLGCTVEEIVSVRTQALRSVGSVLSPKAREGRDVVAVA